MARSHDSSQPTRRRFLQQGGAIALGTAALSRVARSVHAGEDDTIRLALIGCGGRGTGAVRDAFGVPDSGPIQLFAAADLNKNRMAGACKAIANQFPDKVNVPEERQFVGFDAYRKAIDLLRPGDIAMCTTRAYIRPVHVEYAVRKGINVFMEKPFASDPGGLKRLLQPGKKRSRRTSRSPPDCSAATPQRVRH